MLGAVIGLSAMAEEKVLGSPLLGTRTRVAADWCHAWSLLGQWSGWVTFPVPATGEWPRHGHLRGILDGYQKRQPNFHKWARPAYEQGALPTLSLLPGEVTIRVLPGDKVYQAMEIEPEFMRPAILHGFGTNTRAAHGAGALWVDAVGGRSLWHGEVAAAMDAPQLPPSHWTTSSCQSTALPAH